MSRENTFVDEKENDEPQSTDETFVQETTAAQETAKSEEEPLTALQAQLQRTQTELTELKDQLLRKAADFDNYRKRIIKEKEETLKFANSGLLTDLVQILDDFERAIRSSEQSKNYDSFHVGIKMIEDQFTSMLEKKYGLKRFDSLGKPFEPDYHEAISTIDQIGEQSIVVEEYQKGYQLHERVLRTAKVRVGNNMESMKENTQEKKGE